MPHIYLTIGANSTKPSLSHPQMTLDQLISKVKTRVAKGEMIDFYGPIVVQIGTNEKSQFYLSDKVEFLRELLHSLFPFAESFHFKLPVDLNK